MNGFLFFFEGDYGEEDVYSLESLPEGVKTLNFKKFDDYSSLMGVMSEYAAHLLFPSLPDPQKSIVNRMRNLSLSL